MKDRVPTNFKQSCQSDFKCNSKNSSYLEMRSKKCSTKWLQSVKKLTIIRFTGCHGAKSDCHFTDLSQRTRLCGFGGLGSGFC